MKQILNFSDMVELNGKTVRQNNLEKRHVFPLGTVVDVEVEKYDSNSAGSEINLKGRCRLFVVAHTRDCDGTPLYIISDLPVVYPLNEKLFSPAWLHFHAVSKLTLSGYSQESLRRVPGLPVTLKQSVAEYFGFGA